MSEQPADNTIVGMRAVLFEALRAVGNKDNPMDIERAKAISGVAQTIINSAKVEVEYMKQTGSKGSGFIPELTAPQPGRIVHKLRG